MTVKRRTVLEVTLWPDMAQAGGYSCTLHDLKTVAGVDASVAKGDGAAAVARMKSMPIGDDCFGPGRIREDGHKIPLAYLCEVRQPGGKPPRLASLQANRRYTGRGGVPRAMKIRFRRVIALSSSWPGVSPCALI
jgi:hypothetical protein